jgi:germination protein M
MLTREQTRKIWMGLLVLALTVLFTFVGAGCADQETSKQPQDNTQQEQNNQSKTADTLDTLAGNDEKKPSESQPEISSEPKETSESITLYFGDQEAMYLVPEVRQVVKGNQTLEEVVIAELIEGPSQSDLFQTVPKEAKLISIEVVDSVAYVNFNQDFQSKHWGGSTGEAMTLYSITNSLAKLPGIDQVQFLLEGKKQEAILGHSDTSEPIAPNWKMVKE